jgi:hypothetical protein
MNIKQNIFIFCYLFIKQNFKILNILQKIMNFLFTKNKNFLINRKYIKKIPIWYNIGFF